MKDMTGTAAYDGTRERKFVRESHGGGRREHVRCCAAAEYLFMVFALRKELPESHLAQ